VSRARDGSRDDVGGVLPPCGRSKRLMDAIYQTWALVGERNPNDATIASNENNVSLEFLTSIPFSIACDCIDFRLQKLADLKLLCMYITKICLRQ
jgi:hypothetical protein